MAKIKLGIDTDFSPLVQAGNNIHKLNNEAIDLSNNMTRAFRQSTTESQKFDRSVQENIKDLGRVEKQAESIGTLGRQFSVAKKESDGLGSSLKNMATGFVAGSVITGAMSKVSEAFSHAIAIQKEFEKSIQN